MKTYKSGVEHEPTMAAKPSLHVGKFRAFCRAWKMCEKCDLHKNAHSRVLYRGDLPCDVLFIGEAPGEVEDTLGEPFIGPAGEYLEKHIIAPVKDYTRWDFSYAFTNTVACLPCDPMGAGRKIRAPRLKDEVKQCAPFVTRFIRFADPKFIVLVGRTAESSAKFYDLTRESKTRSQLFGSGLPRLTEIITIEHPSSILRKEKETEKLASTKRAVMRLTKELEVPF